MIFIPGGYKDGLVHVSHLAGYRVEDPKDVCDRGDTVWVKVIE
eukprot:SAG31_NODE_35902_length_318_cov_1.114155_1_plen_42_part_01